MTTFLPDNYELPTTESNYTKFEKDKETKIRILLSWLEQDCIVYYEYFADAENWKTKPIRSVKKFLTTPWINAKSTVKEIWSFKVFNYNTQTVQICSISQKSIKEALLWYIKDNDYGSPLWFDIKITKSWEMLETKYAVIVSPPKPFDFKQIKEDKKIDWAWFLSSEKDVFLVD